MSNNDREKLNVCQFWENVIFNCEKQLGISFGECGKVEEEEVKTKS